MKKQVSKRAVFQRLKRHLLKGNGHQLHKAANNNQSFIDVGLFYTTDVNTGLVADRHINLELYARDEKVMAANEIMIEA